MTRYPTSRPKSAARQGLGKVAVVITTSTEQGKPFLKEKIFNPETRRQHYTHKQLKSAFGLYEEIFRCYIHNQKYPELKIPMLRIH